jgi:hypothetical protein
VAGVYRKAYRKRVPLQKSASLAPSDAPCDRFSELGTYRTSAFQPRGLRPRSRPLPLPRPTAGGYTPLQSINSEDAITWSFFGPLKYGPAATRAGFLRWLFARLDMAADDTVATIDLWRRIPHPEKPSAPGPELDALLHGDRSVVFVEAKWGSPEGIGQGPAGTATQMQLRRDFLERYGRRVYGDRRFMVVGVVLADPIEAAPPQDSEHVATRTIRWEELAEFPGHPAHDQLAAYLAWKRKHSGV